MNANTETTAILNVLGGGTTTKEAKEFLANFMQLAMTKNEATVPLLKRKLGSQKRTWVGEYRFWIWEGENWRIYGSNIKGLCFEVLPELTPTQALKAWREVFQKLR